MSSEKLPRTADHPPPTLGVETDGREVLLVAYPKRCVLPLSGVKEIGRELLARHDIGDEQVSARQFTISREGGRLHVTDARSRHGTWLDGENIADTRQRVEDGSLIRIGETVLVYRKAYLGADTAEPDITPASPAGGQARPPLGSKLVAPFGLALTRRRLEAMRRQPPSPPRALILGPTGSGKELIAGAIAEACGRAHDFDALNVATLEKSLIDSELFGHEAGAFTGATKAQKGFLRAHGGGAVFLDEIGELPLDCQGKLLRVLDSGEIKPLGATASKKVDVLLIVATNKKLKEMVEAGSFRDDLFARLGAPIRLPGLRERREDIFYIAQSLLERLRVRFDRVEVEAVELLLLHEWKMNVRELWTALEQVIAGGPPFKLTLGAVQAALGIEHPMRQHKLDPSRITEALTTCKGNESAAARALGVPRVTLRNARKRLGLL